MSKKKIKDAECLVAANPKIKSRAQLYAYEMKYVDGRKPDTLKQWVTLSDDLIAWSKLDTSINFNDFALLHKYSPSRFKIWNDNDYFVECLEQARFAVWNRRERMAMAEDPVQVIMKTMHFHNPEEQSWQERKLTIDKKSDGPQVVVIERYPETNLVPIRKKE